MGAFIFTDAHRFEWPVNVMVPQGGDYLEIEITGLFEMIDDEEFFAIDGDVRTPSEGVEAEIAKLMMVFKGWKDGDVLDVKGELVMPTDETIRQFLAKRPARLAVTAAYSEAITPTKGHRAKNSAPPPA